GEIDHFVDGADEWMRKRGGGAGFVEELLARVFVLYQPRRDRFERHDAVEPLVLRGVDVAHPPAADQLEDAIVADALRNSFHYASRIAAARSGIMISWCPVSEYPCRRRRRDATRRSSAGGRG